MGNVDTKILQRLTPVEAAVFIEKASIDATEQVAKVMFSMNLSERKAKEAVKSASVMEKAFDKVLKGNGHLLHDSIYEEAAGLYGAFVAINSPVMSYEDATKPDSAMHLVAANVFADDDDNIWEVRKDSAGNSILVKALVEDLSQLIALNPNPSMATAAAVASGNEHLETASLVTIYDTKSNKYHTGVMIDTASAYDFDTKELRRVSPTLAIASSDPIAVIDTACRKATGDMALASEMSNDQRQRLFDYLDALYAHAPAFLSVYKASVARITSM